MTDSNDYHFYRTDNGTLMQLDLATGEEAPVNTTTTLVTRTRYSTQLAARIVQKVREGESILNIAKEDSFPSSAVIYAWVRKYPDFGEALKGAREDRAEYFHDKVIATAEALTDRDEVPVAKEQIAAYKWAAEKGNPSRYGKDKSENNGGNVTIIVDTGIPDAIEIKETTCKIDQIEDAIIMPSETYSSTDYSTVEEAEMAQQSTSESLDEPSTTGCNDTQSVENTTEENTNEHR